MAFPYVRHSADWKDATSATGGGDTSTPLRATALNTIEAGIDSLSDILENATADEILSAISSTSFDWKKITNANVDATAAIAYSKLNLAASIVNADVSTTAAIAGSKLKPARVATTIAGLPGVVEDGALALLRVGSTPFTFVPLVYDSTLGKWVSETHYSPVTTTTVVSSTSTSYVTFAESSRLPIAFFKELWDAGLRPRAFLQGFIRNLSAGVAGDAQLAIETFNNADTSAAVEIQFTDPGITVTGTTGSWQNSGWMAVASGTPTKAQVSMIPRIKSRTAGTVEVQQVSFGFRWESS